MKNNDLQYQHSSGQYDVYIKFVLMKSIFSQDIEEKPNSDVSQGLLPSCTFSKAIIYITNVDLVNDDVYTRFGLILSIRSQDIE